MAVDEGGYERATRSGELVDNVYAICKKKRKTVSMPFCFIESDGARRNRVWG